MSKSSYKNGDLIVIDEPGGKVHIFWTDKKYGTRICRPSMVENGTGGQWDTPWLLLKRGIDPADFKDEVRKLGRPICEECLKLCPIGKDEEG
jgi:hypothetical protein